jgi:mannosyltransferase
MRNRFLVGAILILLLAAALRFHMIESQSFWNDEGNSARLSERSLELIIEGTASDIHPPLYYLILRGWREFLGDSEFSLRAFSAFAGVALAAVVLALGRRLIGSSSYITTLLAGFLVAINPALIYYSQETRMYELLAILAALSTLLLVMWLQGGSKRVILAVAYVLSVAAGLYTHYFFPAILLTQNLFFVLWLAVQWRSGAHLEVEGHHSTRLLRAIGRWIAIMVAVFILYIPWISIYLEQAGDRAPLRGALTVFFLDGMRWSAYGPTLSESPGQWLLIPYVLLALLGAWFGRHKLERGVPYTPILLLSIFIPLLLMWLLGATQPAFFKFILVVIPPLCLLAGPGWLWGWKWTFDRSHSGDRASESGIGSTSSEDASVGYGLRLAARILMLVAAGAVLVGSGRSLLNMYFDADYARADYRGVAELIAKESEPNAAIVLNAANQWEVFTYYHQEGAQVYPLPRGYPDPAIIDQELSDIASKHSRIYALFWGEAERDPQRLVERWLDANSFKARDEWMGDVRFVTYAVPSFTGELVELDNITVKGAQFGDSIQLESVRMDDGDPQPGDIIQIQLNWRTSELLDERYKVFLHLVNSDGAIAAQRDSEPGGGLALTTTWEPGVIVTDNHGILVPFGTPSGQYSLLVGLYDTFDPSARLPVTTLDGVRDSLLLATIEVGEAE